MKFERKENEEVKKIMHCPVDLGFNILYDGKQVGHIFLNELITGGSVSYTHLTLPTKLEV